MRGAEFPVSGRWSSRLFVLLVALAALLAGSIVPARALAANGWSAPVPVSPGFAAVSVSCASSSFCVAVDPAAALVYNGTSWTAGTAGIDATGNVASVSCPSSTFCMAVDDAGNALSFDGSRWSGLTEIDGGNFLDSVSCSSSTSCVAVDAQGDALTYDGSAWSTPAAVDPGNGLDSVSCPSSSFCVAVDSAGRALTRTGGAWTPPAEIDGTNVLSSVSCTSASFCAAVDFEGNALGFGGSSWTPVDADPGINIPFAVSCGSPSSCTAVDTTGNAFAYNGATWSTPEAIDPTANAKLLALSCPSATFCATVDTNGNALTYSVAGPPLPATPVAAGGVGAPVAGGTAPVNTASPSITGPRVVGDALSCSTGSWAGTTPQTYAYQWLRDTSPIPGATDHVYKVTTDDAGETLTCRVTSTNGLGSASATTPGATVPIRSIDTVGTVRVGRPTVSGTTIRLLLSCAGVTRQTCTITLKLTVTEQIRPGRPIALSASARTWRTTNRTVSVGAQSTRLSGGRSRTVRVELNATGRRLLAGHGRLSVSLTASRRSSTGSSIRISTQTVAFRAAARAPGR